MLCSTSAARARAAGLKLYLDRAYMGGGTFGAAAAADYYFGKNLKDITGLRRADWIWPSVR
jgi:membrane carboxypeptidase/penicillin-binding protein